MHNHLLHNSRDITVRINHNSRTVTLLKNSLDGKSIPLSNIAFFQSGHTRNSCNLAGTFSGFGCTDLPDGDFTVYPVQEIIVQPQLGVRVYDNSDICALVVKLGDYWGLIDPSQVFVTYDIG